MYIDPVRPVLKSASVVISIFLWLAATVCGQLPEEGVDPPGTILIEDNDSSAVETTWEATSGGPPFETVTSGGTVMYFAKRKTTGDGSQKVTVAPEIPQDGWYQVWMRWVTHANTVAQHEARVPATIFTPGGPFEFTLNQQSGNDWVLLGSYRFEKGKRPLISFSNEGTSQGANWDAIKLIPLAGKPDARPAPNPHPGDDGFAVLKRNVTEFEVSNAYGRGEEETDPEAIRMAALSELQARTLWDLMLDKPNGNSTSNWGQTSNTASSNLTAEAINLRRMAVAYAGASNHLGMDLRGNPELLKATLRGLKKFTGRYNDTTKWDVNWWDYEIGVPQHLLPALIVLKDAVPPDLRDGYLAAVKRFNSDPRKFYNNGFPSTGANRLWVCRVAMYRGALAEDAELLQLVSQAIMEPIEFVERDLASGKTTEGYYEDGSFIQHGAIPYVASYGYLLLESYAVVADGLQGTPWELTGPGNENVFRIMENSFDPFVVRGETIQNVLGRFFGSPNYAGHRNAANFVVTATKLLPFASPKQATRLRSLIKKWITEEETGQLLETAMKSADAANPVSLVTLREIAEDDSIAPLPPRKGFEVFPNMDIVTHRTGEFAISLGMNSTRIMTFESIWGVNTKGWYQSEGLALVYTPDVERYRDGYVKLADPYRLPGIMVERLEREPASKDGANPGKPGGGDFVGGVALDGNGLAAMHLKPAVGSLEARRAWFFLGDQIVALGAGIEADSEHPVETIIENARLISDDQQLVVDGKPAGKGQNTWQDAKWAWLKGKRAGADLGWLFLQGNPALHTLIETRTVEGESPDETEPSMEFATLWFDHGSVPKDGAYAYILLPGRNADEIQAYAKKPAVEVSNNATLQTVRDATGGFTGVVAWEAGEIDGIVVDQPVLLMIHEQGGKLSLAVSDPTMKLNTPVTIRLPHSVKSVAQPNDRITVVSQSPLELGFNPAGANGQSQRIEFSK